MPFVLSLTVADDLAAVALSQARDAGLSVEEFVLKRLRQALLGTSAVPNARSRASWVAEALKRVAELPPGKEFQLQDLFSLDEWKSIPSLTVFGREFRKAVELNMATHVRKTAQNQAIYRVN